jgi:hypothetical protein
MDSTTTNNGLKPNSTVTYDRQVAEALLAEALHDPGVVMAAANDLPAQVFLDPEHRSIWTGIRETFEASGTVSPELVANTLIRHQQLSAAGGVDNLIRLAEQAPYAVHFNRHIEILREHFERRKLHEMFSRRAAVAADLSIDWNDVVEYANLPTIEPTGAVSVSTGWELVQGHPEMRPAILQGLARAGEVGLIVAPSKLGKSHLLYGMLLSYLAKMRWLDTFAPGDGEGRVLLVDNELHPETLAARLNHAAESLGLSLRDDIGDRLRTVCFRGLACTVDDISRVVSRGSYTLVCVDAMYRTYGPGDGENDNTAMTRLFNRWVKLAKDTGAAVALIHHSPKGSMTERHVRDIAAGAGALVRACDFSLMLREHAEPGAAVVGVVVRSWRTPEPFVIRFDADRLAWRRDDDLSPESLKGAPKSADERAADRETARERKAAETAKRNDDRVSGVLRTHNRTWLTGSKIRSLGNLSGQVFNASLVRLLEAGTVVSRPAGKGGGMEYLLKECLEAVSAAQAEAERAAVGQDLDLDNSPPVPPPAVQVRVGPDVEAAPDGMRLDNPSCPSCPSESQEPKPKRKRSKGKNDPKKQQTLVVLDASSLVEPSAVDVAGDLDAVPEVVADVSEGVPF